MKTWHIDPVHTEVSFKVRHLMVSMVRGHFKNVSGSVVTSSDDFLDGKVHVEIDAASVETRNDARDAHLKSADFLDVTQFPIVTFVSSSFTKKGDGYALAGELIMRGVAKPITFDVKMHGIGPNMDGSGRVAGFEGKGKISRQDFGLVWNVVLESGGLTVGDEVEIELNVELKEEKA